MRVSFIIGVATKTEEYVPTRTPMINANNKEIYSFNENEKVVHDVITLAKSKNIKKIILLKLSK